MEYSKIKISILLLLLISGCIPWQYTELPKVKGTVIDSRTKLPIDEATVKIKNKYKDSSTGLTTFTSIDGNFEFFKKTRRAVQPLFLPAIDHLPMIWEISINKINYIQYVSTLEPINNSTEFDLGVIELQMK